MNTVTSPHTNVSPSAGFHRPIVNMVGADRIARIILGAAAVVVGAFLLTAAVTTLAVILEGLLIVAGLVMLTIGTFGYCPTYQLLGYVPRSLRRTS